MKTIKNLFATIVFLSIFLSCTNDLNITPEDDQTVLSEKLFEDENAYKEVLAGVYANLSLTGIDGPASSNIQGLDAGTSQYGRTLVYLQTLSADQMIWSYENDPGTREIQRSIWTAQNPLIIGMFSRASVSIAFANNFLRETTDAKLDSRNVSATTRTDIVNFRAEARLLRALAYYHLMDLFGKAPFVTEDDPTTNFNPPQIERAELFTFLEAELNAIEPDLLAPRQNEHGRADKAVAWMILAKMYLNAEVYIGQAKYTECIENCNKIISGGYSLATNYAHIFQADNNTNSANNEIIFPLISDGLTTQNFGPTTVMTNGAVGSIEKNGANIGVGPEGWGGAIRLREQFVDLFSDGIYNNDTRNTIISGTRTKKILDISDQDQGYVLEKFSSLTSTGTLGSDPGLTFSDTDFPLFRLADVYLMQTEAILRGGTGETLNNSIGNLNALRTRANNPQNNLTAAEVDLNFILDERARELHWEAHRRQDLIRFGKFTGGNYNWAWKGNGSNGIAIPDYFKVYPIPTPSIASNPNLIQNTGY